MIRGRVTTDGIPTVSLTVAGKAWPATIDTGFNDDLELPEALRPFVNPRFLAPTEWLLAGDQRIVEDTYEVAFPFDGDTLAAEATFVPGNTILLGTGLMAHDRLTVDFDAGSVLLERSVRGLDVASLTDPMRSIYYRLVGANLTDAGIRQREGLPNLTALDLCKTKVTAAKIDELKKALPKCKIEWDSGVVEPRCVSRFAGRIPETLRLEERREEDAAVETGTVACDRIMASLYFKEGIMEPKGTIHNGVVVLETEAPLPEGTRVMVTPCEPTSGTSEKVVPTIFERYRAIIGIAPELPTDMAENHDHYIHGTPKK